MDEGWFKEELLRTLRHIDQSLTELVNIAHDMTDLKIVPLGEGWERKDEIQDTGNLTDRA